ncbi:hypothetical protein TWF694_011547 [Orbilia ellipsospora]|uniref:Uncharacterized protein n=1 Tax=Orbilia ellipsospora TaxID=2528407 RepID=A0AAV9X5L1_9PEZI
MLIHAIIILPLLPRIFAHPPTEDRVISLPELQSVIPCVPAGDQDISVRHEDINLKDEPNCGLLEDLPRLRLYDPNDDIEPDPPNKDIADDPPTEIEPVTQNEVPPDVSLAEPLSTEDIQKLLFNIDPVFEKRNINPKNERALAKRQVNEQTTKGISPEQWMEWYEDNKNEFEPLYDAVNATLEYGQDLSTQAYQELRANKGTSNPVPFLTGSLYPILTELEGFTDLAQKEMVMKWLNYNEPGDGMIYVDDEKVKAFESEFGPMNFAFSAAVKNVANPGSKFRTNKEAGAFEGWAKGSAKTALRVREVAGALEDVFAGVSKLMDYYPLLNFEIVDVKFDDLNGGEDASWETLRRPTVQASASVRQPATERQVLNSGYMQRQQGTVMRQPIVMQQPVVMTNTAPGNINGDSDDQSDSSGYSSFSIESDLDVEGQDEMLDSNIAGWLRSSVLASN